MTVFYLVRHGETTWNKEKKYQGHADIPLNEEGREQARLLALKLKDITPTALWSSDLARAKETARIIGQDHQLPLNTHEGLRELDFGPWDGLTWQEIEAKYPLDWAKWAKNPMAYQIPNAESVEDLEKRFRQALLEICQKHPQGNVFLVAHGGPLGKFIGSLTAKDYWESRFKNCSCVRVKCQEGKFEYLGPLEG